MLPKYLINLQRLFKIHFESTQTCYTLCKNISQSNHCFSNEIYLGELDEYVEREGRRDRQTRGCYTDGEVRVDECVIFCHMWPIKHVVPERSHGRHIVPSPILLPVTLGLSISSSIMQDNVINQSILQRPREKMMHVVHHGK